MSPQPTTSLHLLHLSLLLSTALAQTSHPHPQIQLQLQIQPQLQPRALPPLRGLTPEIPPPRPNLPETPGGSLGIAGGGIRPISGSNAFGDGFSPAAAGGRGTAAESTSPFLSGSADVGGDVGGGGERKRELVGKAVEAAGEVFDILQGVVDVFGGGYGGEDGEEEGDDVAKWRASTTTTARLAQSTQGASSDGTSNATTTANYLLSYNNETYTFPSDPRLMGKDIVAEMADDITTKSSSPRLKAYQDLFTPSEYRMYLEDPICFYANIESMYLEAFSSWSSSRPSSIPSSSIKTGAGATSASPTPTTQPLIQRRQSPTDETPTPPSQNPPQQAAASISSLWATELPNQLWSAHFASPASASDGSNGESEVTATATSTTSCSGLNGGQGPVTGYRELKYRETSGGAETTLAAVVENSVARVGGKRWFEGGLIGGIVVVVAAAAGALVL